VNLLPPLLGRNDQLRETFARLDFVTGSEAMIPLLRQASKAASISDVTILLEGETGTGKQVLARAIHELDQKRRGGPFITVNCPTVTEALAESELFGHYRGAFTGAVSNRKGLFHAANHGTLLFDDVNDLPLPLQSKLLDVIQRGVVRSIGSDQESPVDIRIIAACNQPLHPLVIQNRFRADLYHRLNVIRLRLPPLRERPEDLSALVLAFARRHASIYGPIEGVDADFLAFLKAQLFPGNVRELENAVQRMLFCKTQGTSLTLADWKLQSEDEKTERRHNPVNDAADCLWEAISLRGLSFAQALREIERRIIETALRDGGYTRRQVATQLRTSERTLYHKMRAYGLGERGMAKPHPPETHC
jgi:two-component system, NtrC family, response regulator AtoC